MDRLTKDISLTPGARFLLLYGYVQDAFVTLDHVLVDAEQALYMWLKEQGFNTVVFYAPDQALYNYDAASRQDIWNLATGNTKATVDTHRASKLKTPNPRGEDFWEEQEDPHTAIESDYPIRQSASTPEKDVTALSVLDAVMQRTTRKSAVVLTDSERLLSTFDDPRMLSSTIGLWDRLPPENRNLCLWLLRGDPGAFVALLDSSSKNQRPFPELHAIAEQAFTKRAQRPNQQVAGYQVARIATPSAKELNALVDLMRLRREVKIAWPDRERLIEWLAVEGAAHKIGISGWWAQFKDIRDVSWKAASQYTVLSEETRNSMPVEGQSALQQLLNLTGLDEIKTRIDMLTRRASREEKRRKAGLPVDTEPVSLHMGFLGNPGTGKTTVARLVGLILRDLGLLQRGHTIEIERIHELQGQYVGHTSVLTHCKVDEALDGVLFIDEAYQLGEPDNGGFGREAIAALVTRLENDRDRLVVIVAGYPEKMEQLYNVNPGMIGRIRNNSVCFPDFTPEQLIQVLVKEAKKRHFVLSEEVFSLCTQIVTKMYDHRGENFDNARRMRSFAESLAEHCSYRLEASDFPVNEIEQVEVEDIPAEYLQVLSL